MTETIKAKPCPVCGREPVERRERQAFYMICREAHMTKPYVYAGSHKLETRRRETKEEAIQAWNKLVELSRPAPQWTTEPPKKEGFYWVRTPCTFCGKPGWSIRPAHIFLDGDCKVINAGYVENRQDFHQWCKKHPDDQWLCIPAPPFPEERKETDDE